MTIIPIESYRDSSRDRSGNRAIFSFFVLQRNYELSTQACKIAQTPKSFPDKKPQKRIEESKIAFKNFGISQGPNIAREKKREKKKRNT